MTDLERRLVLLRHAKSDWSTGEPDHARPLNVRGRRDGPAAGRWLRHNVGRVDVVVCSPATRTRQTWDLVSPALTDPPAPVYDERVYDAPAMVLFDVVRGLPEDATTALLIGHNPGVEDVTVLLAGEMLPMTTAAIAVLSWPGSWTDVGLIPATLRAHASPRG
jgi:phosphohistidine phosphatase